MTRGPAERDDEEARMLVDLARRDLLTTTQRCDDTSEAARLVAAWTRELAERAPRRRRNFGFAVLGLATCAGLLLMVKVTRQVPLTHVVTSGVNGNGRPDATAGERRYLFSDGTSILLAGQSAIEPEEQNPHRPIVRLQRGTALVNVIHRPQTHWMFLAGPFEVDVVGTTFDLAWDPAAQSFSLVLKEGKVRVRSPLQPEPLESSAPESVFAPRS